MSVPSKSRRLPAAAVAVLAATLTLGAVAPAAAVAPTAAVDATGAAGVESISDRNASGLKAHRAKIEEFHRLINAFRTGRGLPALTFNARAAADAYDWSWTMAKAGTIWHQDGPDDFADSWGVWGENVAYGGATAAGMFAQWKNSPPHRANMLDRDFDTYGIGFYVDRNGTMYGTTVFYGIGDGSKNLPDSYTRPADYFTGKPALPVSGVQPKPGPFTDVPRDHTFYAPIQWMKAEGLTNGYSDGSFGVKRPITRGESASFLYRISGETHTPSGTAPFSDIRDSSHAVAIDWMEENGYSQGYADGTYRPNQEVTRGELASLVYRSSGADHTAPTKPFFKDVKTTSPHYEAIDWLRGAAGISGYADGTFRPGRDITRGESAKMLYALR